MKNKEKYKEWHIIRQGYMTIDPKVTAIPYPSYPRYKYILWRVDLMGSDDINYSIFSTNDYEEAYQEVTKLNQIQEIME